MSPSDVSLLQELSSPQLSQKTILEGVPANELRLALSEKWPFLWLDSREGGQHHLLLGHKWQISNYPSGCRLEIDGQEKTIETTPNLSNLFDALHSHWLPSQSGGLKLGFFISYEAGWESEVRRHPRPTDADLPLWSIFCPEEVLTLNQSGQLSHLHGENPRFNLSALSNPPRKNYAKGVQLRALQTQEDYVTKVLSLKEHIRQGDSFQVNLSQTIHGEGSVHALDWAKHAIEKEGGGFSALWYENDFKVMSLSPERLLRIEGRRLITRPIAGTLPRHPKPSPENLKAFAEHPKELAEHNMLIDLERNDLGKVSQPGSVEITEQLTIETLPHVHHLVSQVEGTLEEGVGYGEALSAVFPGGTITGCPKLETMHLLDTHELGPRGPYTGSLGFLSQETLDSNILIRSALVKDDEVIMRFGGGIVWDSDPEKEYLETIAKSRGIVQSLIEGGASVDPDHRSLRQFFS